MTTSNNFQTEKSKYEVRYGNDVFERYAYISYFDTRAEMLAAVKDYIIQYNFVNIQKINSNETI